MTQIDIVELTDNILHLISVLMFPVLGTKF